MGELTDKHQFKSIRVLVGPIINQAGINNKRLHLRPINHVLLLLLLKCYSPCALTNDIIRVIYHIFHSKLAQTRSSDPNRPTRGSKP